MTQTYKFQSNMEKQIFLTEIEEEFGSSDSSSVNEFIKRRKNRVTKLVNFRKKQIAKHQWRSNRFKLMVGIKKFHRSIAGKRFHRSLGRYLATRYSKKLFSESSIGLLRSLALKGVSSLKTHIYIEDSYYRPFMDDVEYTEFRDYVVPILTNLELKLNSEENPEFTEEELDVLLSLTDERELWKSIAEVHGIPVSSVDDLTDNFLVSRIKELKSIYMEDGDE